MCHCLFFIIKAFIFVISLFKDWRKSQMLAELLRVIRAGIGSELCHSDSKYSLTSSVLLSWCSLRGGRGMDLFCVSRRRSLSLLLTTCPWLTVHRRDWEEAALFTHLLARVYVASLNLFKYFTFTSCGSPEECWRGGAFVFGQCSSDGRQCWLRLGLGMLNGGREGLFELGQQLQQQGEYQAALHCFLSCLLGLTHVQSFTSLPNCLHQVSQMGTEHTHDHTYRHTYMIVYYLYPQNWSYHIHVHTSA